jgi:DNA methyltransferase 1-associated protein 1
MRYNDEEYKSLIKKEPGWSREETDYLLDQCAAFELRFTAIADRYEVGASRGRRVHGWVLGRHLEALDCRC